MTEPLPRRCIRQSLSSQKGRLRFMSLWRTKVLEGRQRVLFVPLSQIPLWRKYNLVSKTSERQTNPQMYFVWMKGGTVTKWALLNHPSVREYETNSVYSTPAALWIWIWIWLVHSGYVTIQYIFVASVRLISFAAFFLLNITSILQCGLHLPLEKKILQIRIQEFSRRVTGGQGQDGSCKTRSRWLVLT